MIKIPPGFDLTAFINQLFTIGGVFIEISVLLVGYVVIQKALKHGIKQ